VTGMIAMTCSCINSYMLYIIFLIIGTACVKFDNSIDMCKYSVGGVFHMLAYFLYIYFQLKFKTVTTQLL